MSFDEFRNEANKLRFVDEDQVRFLGDRWPAFRDDPIRFVLALKNRDVAERVWGAAQAASRR